MMEAITTLSQLEYNLNMGSGYDGYGAMVSAIDFDEAEVQRVCRWPHEGYSRIRLYDTPSTEALVTCWQPGSMSPIHDYQLQQGWVKVLKGSLELEYFDISKGTAQLYGNRVINEGKYVYLNDGMGYHRFINNSNSKTVAIHLYCDKIEKWNEFDPSNGIVKEVEVKCDINLDLSS